ncbi:S8 family serine peptidase [Paenibacillus sp. M1]|uniref:S8 family serine peptidase n=1 Tax=Paenibacillus haidiansis TaxID=1574488 RepID=A0ABU7VVT6_9BACL
MRGRTLFRKLPVLTLAVGLVAGALPGFAGAASPDPFSPPGRSIESLENSLLLNADRITDAVQAASADQIDEPLISPRINTKSTRNVRVIVQLEGEPAAVGKYAEQIGDTDLAAEASETSVKQEQKSFLAQASKQGIDLKVNYQYNTVLNGFEVTIPADQIPELAAIPGIKSIQENSTWYPVPIETTSIDSSDINYEINPIRQIGADAAWAEKLTGKGLKVGVIDTGVDYYHPDIKDAYKGGYDSFYQDNDPYEEPSLTPEEDEYGTGFAGTSHGTHVAGTIVGRAANTESEIVQKGVAYEADLYAYKVLGRNPDNPDKASGSSAQVIDGIERAVKDGMDVINLSLGSDTEKDVNSPDAIAINNAVLSGVVAVIANGNAGPGYYTLGSPATSQLAIAVGAVDSDSLHYSGSFEPEFVDASSVTTATYATYDFNVMGWETLNDDFTNIFGTDPQEVVYAGLGGPSDYDGLDVDGKIVLVSRGNYAFVDKVAVAKANGAKAILIFNGRANGTEADLSEDIPSAYDGHINVSLGDSFTFIPALDLKGTDGRALARALLDNPELKLQISFDSEYDREEVDGDLLASFSSWGPNADPDLSIKPDIMAPGYNVISSVPAYGKVKEDASYEKAYERSSGTSMAAPHIAGLALLLKQQHPKWTPADIRAALANTADVLSDENGEPYDVYQQGAGRANVAEAIETPALLQAVEPIQILNPNYKLINVTNYNSSASFGVLPAGSKSTKTLQLKNTSKRTVNYKAEVEWHGDHAGVDARLKNTSISAKAGKTSKFDLTLNVGKGAEGGFYEGQVNLTSPGYPELHLPFVVYVGDELPVNGFGVQEFQLTNSTVYPNRNKQNTTDLSFRLTAENANYIEIDLLNLEDETIGLLGNFITDTASDFFEPGVFNIEGISNEYYPYDEDGYLIVDENGVPVTSYLEEGSYKIVVYAAQLNEYGGIALDEYGNPIIYSGIISYKVDLSKSPGGGKPGSGKPDHGKPGKPGNGKPDNGKPGGGKPGGGKKP